MRLIRRFAGSPAGMILLASVVAGCSGGNNTPPGPPANNGGTTGKTGGSGGNKGSGGSSSATGGTTVPGTGGSGGSAAPDSGSSGGDDASQPVPDAGTSDGNTPPPLDAGGDAWVTPMGTEGNGPQPSYEGIIPIYYGPEVGPKVEMQCAEDPTQGWTEYQDGFNIQRPFDKPINQRFSIIGGIYNFWVFPNDAPHSPTANGRNPRTEARYGHIADAATARNFTTGNRLYSADFLIERNAVNSAIMQIHTTADGGGPIGLRITNAGDMVNNGSLTVVRGSTVPGGLVDKWFNFKASLNADTLEVKIYINNCLKSTYKGPRGDGNFYFKNGVYFCKTSQNGCRAHFKNIHLYKK